MADFGWLRNLGQRGRNSNVSASTLYTDWLPLQSHTDDSRRPTPLQVTSYLRLKSRTLLSPQTSPVSRDALLVRKEDRVWHNPSLTQMVETLQSVMMTKNVLEPLPAEYNSYILHLLEGFAVLDKKANIAEKTLRYANDAHNAESRKFQLLCNDWRQREKQYKAEIKRLEVLLSKTRDGLESVALARVNSVVARSGKQHKEFTSRLDGFADAKLERPPCKVPRTSFGFRSSS